MPVARPTASQRQDAAGIPRQKFVRGSTLEQNPCRRKIRGRLGWVLGLRHL